MTRLLDQSDFDVTHHFGAKEARDNQKVLLDRAEAGVVTVVHRNRPVVMTSRDAFDAVLAVQAPFSVNVSVLPDQVSMWIDGLPTHAVAPTLDEAEDAFLDALVEYAVDWVEELRFAPNHKQHYSLVQRILIYAEDREEFRRVVFDENE